MDLEVDMASLRLRLETVERRVFGDAEAVPGAQPLFRLYTLLLLDGLESREESAVLMRTCAMMMTPRLIFDLCVLTQDMFAWRPFLLTLDKLSLKFDVQEAIERLEYCIRAVMNAQGLNRLKISDVIRSPVGPLANLKSFALSELQRSQG